MYKVLMCAAAASALALGVLTASLGHSQEAPKSVAPPSWGAQCGFLWRQHKVATGETGRDAYLAFMRSPVGCGAKAAKFGNDERIKEYLEQHPLVKPQTWNAGDENQPSYQEARGRKK